MVNRESVSVSMPPDMVAGLKAEAERRDVSVSQVVRERIRAGQSKMGYSRD